MNEMLELQRPHRHVAPFIGSGREDAAGLEPLAVPFGRILTILRRHLWIILLTVAMGVGGTAIVVKGMPRRFTAEASIIIEPQRTQVSDLQAISSGSEDVSSMVRTQIDILHSPALAVGVVRALHLVDNPEFEPQPAGLTVKLKGWLQRVGVLSVAPPSRPTSGDTLIIAADALSRKISFGNEARSSLLSVDVTTNDPKLSANIANEVAKQFLAFKVEEKFAAMQRAHDWLQGQVAALAVQVRVGDLAVENYRIEHGLGDEAPGDANGNSYGRSVTRQSLDAISGQLAEVSRDRALREGQLTQGQLALHGHLAAATLPQVQLSPVVSALVNETAATAGREALLAASEGPDNPELLAVRAQLARLQARTREEMANVARSLSSEVAALRAQEQALRTHMDQLRSAVSAENSAELGLQSLETQARATRNVYESFLSRAAQLANVGGIQVPDASLVSSAEPPLGASSPQGARLLAVAMVLSLALGISIACVIERLRRGFSFPEQVESMLGLPLLALVPTIRPGAMRRPNKTRPALAFTASLDRLRGQMRVLDEDQPKIVMVTSALPREGKSVFSAELGRNMAAAGWRVLLLECDFLCPSLARQFGLPIGPGLCEILAGGLIGERDSLVHEPEPRLHVVVAGQVIGDSQELLASKRMGGLLTAVRAEYDLVILDTPPVLPAADALVLARQADATVAVVRWETTPRHAAIDALRLLRATGAQLMGMVMTGVDMRTATILGGRMSYAFTNYDGYRMSRRSHAP